jgi:hypothetical protein
MPRLATTYVSNGSCVGPDQAQVAGQALLALVESAGEILKHRTEFYDELVIPACKLILDIALGPAG